MESLCKKIASLPINASKETIHDILEPQLKEEISRLKESGRKDHKPKVDVDVDVNVDVTPFMVACDKSQSACLEYFISLLENETKCNTTWTEKVRVLGRPLDPSPDHRNQAVHYAVMSKCPEMIASIVKLLGIYKLSDHRYQDDGNNNNNNKDKNIPLHSPFKNYITVLSQRNSHGDTPIMIASFMGESAMIELWFKEMLSFAKDEGLVWEKCCTEIRNLIRLENNSNGSALSLAFGHGHFDVVNSLIKERKPWDSDIIMSDGFLLVNPSDIERATIIHNKATSSLKNTEKGEHLELKQNKVNDIRRCLVMLKVSCTKLADKRLKELLIAAEEDDQKRISRNECAKKKTNNKQKQSKSSMHNDSQYKAVKTDVDLNSLKDIDVHVEEEEEQYSQTVATMQPFVTLNDGAVVSRKEKEGYEASLIQQEVEETARIKNQKNVTTIQSLLRDRYSQPTITTYDSPEAMMESLCIDASMLLLSPHGMAMELSPCQLDVVETVLKQQLSSVVAAKEIHKRLMSNHNVESNDNNDLII